MRNIFFTYLFLFSLLLSGGIGNAVAQNSFDSTDLITDNNVSYSIHLDNSRVSLEWEVQPKKEVSSYLIERSFNDKLYIPIYQTYYLKGGAYYSDLLTNANLSKEFIYYRLRINYKDGSYEIVDFDPLNILEGKDLRPTIIASESLVEVSFLAQFSGNVTLQVFNTTGNLVTNENIFAQKGKNYHNIDTYQLRNGMYFLRLQQNNKVTTSKFFIR